MNWDHFVKNVSSVQAALPVVERPLEIMLREHADILQRLRFREDAEVKLIMGESMNTAREILDLTDTCHKKSPIERIMCIHLRKWISKQEHPHSYTLSTSYYVESMDIVIDLLLCRRMPETSLCIAIECDGSHHSKPLQKKRDQERDRLLIKKYGIETLRFRGAQIFNSPENCIREVAISMKQLEAEYDDIY